MKVKKLFLSVKDHSVSGEEFQLLLNEELEMLETFPQPSSESLSKYYDSENYISHTDGQRNLLEIAYQFVKTISLKRKLKLINSFSLKGKSLLDVGCGTGDFLRIALQNNWKVGGIEPNEKARQIANVKTNNEIFDSEQLLKFQKNSFDVITLWHVLEHLPKLEEHLEIFKSLLKPEGFLVIAVPNYNCYDAFYYKGHWAAYDAPRHLWHFSRNSIMRLGERKNMKVVKILPMYFDAYYVSLLSEKYKSKIMNPLRAFCIGWWSNFKAKRSGEYSSLIYLIKNNGN